MLLLISFLVQPNNSNTRRRLVKYATYHTQSKLSNNMCLADLSSPHEIILKKPSTDHNQYSKLKAKTPRLSMCKISTHKQTQRDNPKSVKNSIKRKIDLQNTFHKKEDYRRTFIIDNDGNNNFKLFPKKMLSDNDLFVKFSRLKIDKQMKETNDVNLNHNPKPMISNDFFTQKRREEIENIKPLDDNDSNFNNSNDTVLMMSFISSGLNEQDKTVVQDDYLLHPIYTPRQIFNKSNKKVSFTQMA